MTKIKLLKQYFYEIYLLFMSSIIISLFIYYRLILKRSTYSLETLKYKVDLTYLLIDFGFITLHLFIIITIIYNLIVSNKEDNKIITYVKHIIDIIIWKPLNYFLDLLAPHIPYSGTFIISVYLFFRKNNLRLTFMKVLTIIFFVMPRIFMSFLFFYEIVLNNKLENFINFIWILLLPLFYLIFLNLSEKFYINNIIEVDKILEVTPTGIPNKNGVYTSHKFNQKNKNDYYTEEDFNEIIETWSLLFYVLNLTQIIRQFIMQISPYLTLTTSSLYLSALMYKMYYLILY